MGFSELVVVSPKDDRVLGRKKCTEGASGAVDVLRKVKVFDNLADVFNDDDVNVLEVEHLIKSLKADGKKFEYEIYQAIPGGHSFDRIDTKKANQIRVKIYKFLADKLRPPNPIRNLGDLREAAYRY